MANSKPSGISFSDPVLDGAVLNNSTGSGLTLNNVSISNSARNSFSSIGDSILAFGNNAASGTTSNSHVGWFNDLARQNGEPGIEFIDYQALGGTTLQQLISTQIPLALKADSDGVWMHSGANNLNASSSSNDPVETILNLYDQAITAVMAKKKVMIVDSLMPVLQSGTTQSRFRAFSFPAVNARLKAICAKPGRGNVLFNDVWNPGVGPYPYSASLNPLANIVRTDDGVHMQSNGSFVYGYASYENLHDKLNLRPYYSVGPNLLPAFTGTGGTVTPGTFITVTGTPPVGYELVGVSGLAASHSCDITSLAPNMTRFTFSNTGASAATTYVRVNNLQSSVVAGGKIMGGFGFQLSGLVNFNRLAMNLRRNSSIVWNGMAHDTINEPTIIYPTIAHGGFRTCPFWDIPNVTISNWEFIIAINVGPSNGAAVVDLYNPTMNMVTGINPA